MGSLNGELDGERDTTKSSLEISVGSGVSSLPFPLSISGEELRLPWSPELSSGGGCKL